jgi:putative nucleotidyltransferase with HDIG domain
MSRSREPDSPPPPDLDPQQPKSGVGKAGVLARLLALPHRLMPRFDALLDRRWVQAVVLLLISLPMAIILGPSFTGRSDRISTKLKVGDRAATNIKVTRDFQYLPSAHELEKQRKAAADRVHPVFDHYADQGPSLIARVSHAFRGAAKTLGHHKANKPAPQPAPPAPANVKKDKKIAKKQKLDPKVAPSPSEKAPHPSVDMVLLRRDFEKQLEIKLGDKSFNQLAKSGFSPEVLASLVVVLGSAMDNLIVAYPMQAFKGKPITVRHLVAGRIGSQGEEHIARFDKVRGLSQIKQDIRNSVNVHASRLGLATRNAVAEIAVNIVTPNLIYNTEVTRRRKQEARTAIKEEPLTLVRGQVLVRDGDPITAKHLRIIEAMEQTYQGVSLVQVVVGIGLFVLLVLVVVHRYAAQHFKRFQLCPRDLVLMGFLLVGMLGLTRGVIELAGTSNLGIATYMLPVAGGAMLVRLVITAEAAALFGVLAAAFTGMIVGHSVELTLFYMVTGLAAALGVHKVQSRTTVLRAGMVAGLLGAVAVVCLQLFSGDVAVKSLLLSSLAAVAGGLLASFTALALLPVIEWLFAYTTDVSLLELANLNHPLLRELMLRAPGTYHHSMVVGNLAEAACESIGANGLLARVASYYHDVGKMKNAAYFAENFRSEENPHNRLKPSMSSLIIRSHVKDGIEMMREHGIPEIVIQTASQHHGTSLISFFYHKAIAQKEEDDAEILEADYRYPGPKPQSREAGVIMVADGVEAAARSLAEPTEDRLQAVVMKIINTQFTDGQLDQCALTLRDLHQIAKSFLQVLGGIYHARPTYPWQRKEGQKKRETGRTSTVERRDPTGKGKDPAGKGKDPAGKGKDPTGKGKDPTPTGKGKDPTGKEQEQTDTAGKDAAGDQQQAKDPTPTKEKDSAQTIKVTGVPSKAAGSAGAAASTSSKKTDTKPSSVEQNAKRDSSSQKRDSEPSGPGPSKDAPESDDAPEVAAKSSPDLKRLGLN